MQAYRSIQLAEISQQKIKIFFLSFSFLLIFIWPITSTDIFSYIYQSRIISHQNSSPYQQVYNDFPQDNLYHVLNNKWSNNTSPYNPLFLAIGSTITKISNNNLLASLLLFKFIIWLFFISSALLVYKITKSINSFYLFAFNPYLLFEFLINGHNDIMVIFLLLLSLYYLFRKSWQSQFTALSAVFIAFLIKAYALIFLPIVGLKIVLDKTNLVYKAKALSSFILLAITLSFLSLKLIQEKFYLKTLLIPLQNQTSVINDIFLSPLILIIKNLFNISSDWSAFFSKLLFILLFTVLLLFITKKNKSLKKPFSHILIWVVAIFLLYLTAITWFMPWYLTILITLLILLSKEGTINLSFKLNLSFIYIISFFAIMFYMVLR
ncbi:MAG: polyprenol phosphomannose-dependent alpha 1,6 mannosyltransferase MptB [Candidatus Pacebacteria bacterium]|nr:polyprenol phosphomannose-dependent alpha 1,6 mannosyltransferase MptB [Candidatus Paceibacterota bacterium]